MKYKQFKSGSNYSYLVIDETSKEAITIDPITPLELIQTVKENGLKLKYIFNTHGHYDHTSGNTDVKKATGAALCVHKEERIGADIYPVDNETFQVGEINVQIIHTPGHTPGGISIIVNNELFFCGDTIFLAGCGNCNFGGDVKTTYETFSNRLSNLPDHLKVLCGHNYFDINMPFSLSLFSSNEELKKKNIEVQASNSEPLSTMGEEKSYNPFLNFNNPALQKDVANKTGKNLSLGFELFREVRSLKDRG
ncbi:MAG: MBL fold metallo-hydrolase [Nitrospinae bacterium]|nr:MBL fold metallo-hydrolase [Nitrospinota bacterium]